MKMQYVNALMLKCHFEIVFLVHLFEDRMRLFAYQLLFIFESIRFHSIPSERFRQYSSSKVYKFLFSYFAFATCFYLPRLPLQFSIESSRFSNSTLNPSHFESSGSHLSKPVLQSQNRRSHLVQNLAVHRHCHHAAS